MALDLSLLVQDETTTPAVSAAVAPRAPLSEFEEDPCNPRFEDDPAALDQLVEDIRTRGILQPIIVRRTASGKLRIRFGARRYRAARTLGLQDVPYLVTEDDRQFDDYAQVAENERRHALQPLELARFIAKKLADGETRRAVAAKLQLDPSAVTHLAALAGDVPPIVLELYHSRRCRTPQYLYELRRFFEQNPAVVSAAVAKSDVIDKAFLSVLGAEVAQKTATESTLKQSRTDSRGHAGLATASTPSPDRSLRPASERNADTNAPGRPFQPQLCGTVRGRPVILVLDAPPSMPGRVFVREADGLSMEVPIGEVTLTELRHAG